MINWSEISTGIVFSNIASSYDGNKLISMSGRAIYVSSDAGLNWIEQNLPINESMYMLTGIAMSSDGSKLFACVNSEYIYASNDGGLNWTAQTSSGKKNWSGISCSSDGNKLAAICNKYNSSILHQQSEDQESYVCTSTDGGLNWITQTGAGNKNWNSIASSGDGTKLIACAGKGYIYVSHDSGLTWSENTCCEIKEWISVAMSSAGSKMMAISVNPANAHVSMDSGETWESIGGGSWSGIAISPDASIMGACVDNNSDGYVYTSTDGFNWTRHNDIGTRWWDKLTFNQDGTKIFVTHHNDNMFIGDIS